MCRLGATVTGLDATESNIQVADNHRLSLREPQLEKLVFDCGYYKYML